MPRKIIVAIDLDGTTINSRADRHLSSTLFAMARGAEDTKVTLRPSFLRYKHELDQLKDQYGDEIVIQYKIVTARSAFSEPFLSRIGINTSAIIAALAENGIIISEENIIRVPQGFKGDPILSIARKNRDAYVLLLEDQSVQIDDVIQKVAGESHQNAYALYINDDMQFALFQGVIHADDLLDAEPGQLLARIQSVEAELGRGAESQPEIITLIDECFSHIHQSIAMAYKSQDNNDFKLYMKIRCALIACLHQFYGETLNNQPRLIDSLKASIDHLVSVGIHSGVKRAKARRGVTRLFQTISRSATEASEPLKALPNNTFEKNIEKLSTLLYARLPDRDQHDLISHEAAITSNILRNESAGLIYQVRSAFEQSDDDFSSAFESSDVFSPIKYDTLLSLFRFHLLSRFGGSPQLLEQLNKEFESTLLPHALAWAELNKKEFYSYAEVTAFLSRVDLMLEKCIPCPVFFPTFNEADLPEIIAPEIYENTQSIFNHGGEVNPSLSALIGLFLGEMDPARLHQYRVCIQYGLEQIGRLLNEPTTTTQQAWLLEVNRSMLLSFYTYVSEPYPSEKQILSVPQYINDQWQMIPYEVSPLILNQEQANACRQDSIPAFGLLPLDQKQTAHPWLLFRGTPSSPECEGYRVAWQADFTQDETPGESLVLSGLETILAWRDSDPECQMPFMVTGHSLGGSKALAFGYGCPSMIARIDAMDPPGSLQSTFAKEPFCQWLGAENKPVVRVFRHTNDYVSQVGIWPTEAEVYLAVTHVNVPLRDNVLAHGINSYGQPHPCIIQLDTATDNLSKQRQRMNTMKAYTNRALNRGFAFTPSRRATQRSDSPDIEMQEVNGARSCTSDSSERDISPSRRSPG